MDLSGRISVGRTVVVRPIPHDRTVWSLAHDVQSLCGWGGIVSRRRQLYILAFVAYTTALTVTASLAWLVSQHNLAAGIAQFSISMSGNALGGFALVLGILRDDRADRERERAQRAEESAKESDRQTAEARRQTEQALKQADELRQQAERERQQAEHERQKAEGG